MTNEEAIEQLLYMKHGVKAESEQDNALDLAISALYRDRWISVNYANETSFPQKEKCIMVCAFGTTVGEGWYYGWDGFHHVWKLAVSGGTYWDDEVVAWRPLPEPPKEDKP